MSFTFQPISYGQLNGRQKEAYNLQKIGAVLADYGFVAIRMTSDWGGADFIAQHLDGEFLKVQLKARLSFSAKYINKGLHICFRDGDRWFLYPHDEMLQQNLYEGCIGKGFWNEHLGYTNANPSRKQRLLLEPYLLRPGEPIVL
jgi:hypothetical protein